MKRPTSIRRLALLVSACALVALVSVGAGGAALARGRVAAPARQAATPPKTINVSGHGEVNATPDNATITVGVQTKGADAQSALSSNATKMSAVIDAVRGQNVAADHLQTSDLSLYRDVQSDTYVCDHQLTVRLDSVDKVGTVLDAAVGAGANNSWGVTFGLKNLAAQRAQALKSAISDARARADAMAAALGVTVTGVASVSESSSSAPPPIRYGAMAPAVPAASTSTQVQPGQLTITSDVSVTYTFG